MNIGMVKRALGAAVVAVGITATIMMASREEQATVLAGTRVWETSRMILRRALLDAAHREIRAAEGTAHKASQTETPAGRAGAPINEEYLESTPEIVRAAVQSDRGLAPIVYFRQHVLLSPSRRAQYRALLSDPEMVEKVRRDLLFPEDVRETLIGNTKRLMEVDYLRDAVAWQDNPARDDLLDMVEEIILEDNLPAELGMDMRIALSTIKMELFDLLYEHSPKRALGLVDVAGEGRLAELVAFFAAEIPARRERERENSITP